MASTVRGSLAHHQLWPSQNSGRIAHAIRVVDLRGRPVTVAHFHGVRMASGKADTPERLRQAEQVSALLDRVSGPDDLVVVTGDFNVLPDSVTFRVLERTGPTDLVGTADTRTSTYSKPSRHANYLLVSYPDAVVSFQVLTESEVPDHRPLLDI